MVAFPARKYAQYKHATQFFLDWLLRARGRGQHTGQKVQLAAFSSVVREIVAEPTSLTPKLLNELPKALAACQCAITLREHVSAFFSSNTGQASAASQKNHAHFLDLLKAWHAALAEIQVVPSREAGAGSGAVSAAVSSARFKNYYEVLRVADDYFLPGDNTVAVDRGETAATQITQAERERLFNEAFAEDLRLEVIYFFLELEELAEAVFTVYDQVKKQQKTLVEATVVVKVAMDNAKALTSKLQLHYPSIRTAEDVMTIVMDHAPPSFQRKLSSAVAAFWESFSEQGTYTFAPGMLVVDFLSVGRTLSSFTSAIPDGARTSLILRDGFFGEPYGEERTPQYVLPDPSNMLVFLLQQLPLLYNTVAASKLTTSSPFKSSSLSGSFMFLMDEYFTTRKVTVPVVFACICWMKSVAALQGNGGLGRNVSLTFKHSAELAANMEAAIAKRAVYTADKELHDALAKCVAEIKQSDRGHKLARINPVMAGFMMLDYHFQYLHVASEVLLVTSRFRAFGHLYAALLDQGFVQHIPFFDQILEVYADMIFTPSRTAAVRGAYTRTYLLSSHMTASAVDAMFRNAPVPAGPQGIKVRKALHLRDLSKIFRLVTENDLSALGDNIDVASPKMLLSEIADICSKELFETRVLSRDALKLNDDLTDVFSALCDALGRRDFHDRYIATPTPGESHQYRVNRALEDAVMMPLLPFLDTLSSDGSLDLSTLPGGRGSPLAGALQYERVQSYCKLAAFVVMGKFASSPLICERKYFTFPLRPDFVAQEFGTEVFKRQADSADRETVFSDLMDTLEESNGPLSPTELRRLKSQIKKDPELLRMVSLCSISGSDLSTLSSETSQQDELCSLLHQAAAGPAHDASLVEWMVQMGALFNQPTIHCRREPRQRELSMPRQYLANTMAVHSAVIAGHADIAQILLEADNMVDLNTRTFHTKESLAHLAVKHGHREIYSMLEALGADLRAKDGNGRRVCDVTADPEWQCKIAASTATIERSQANCEGAKNREAMFQHQGKVRAERLRRSVSSHRDQERRQAFRQEAQKTAMSDTREPRGAIKSKKKKKKGKKGTAKDKTTKSGGAAQASSGNSQPPADASVVSGLLKELLLPSEGGAPEEEAPARNAVLGEPLEEISAMFLRFRKPDVSMEDKAADVQRVCSVIQRVTSLVQATSLKSRMNSSSHKFRAALTSDAVQLIHLMQKLHRFEPPVAAVSVLAPARELCGTTLPFAQFVVGAAEICASVDRKTQARELLDLLEKRFVKSPFSNRKPPAFRDMVQLYSSARNEIGLGRTTSTESFDRLEWYLDNAVEDYDLQVTLDGMDGRPFYFAYTTTASNSQFYDFQSELASNLALDRVACYGKRVKHVVYGGSSKADVAKTRELLLQVATRVGIDFAEDTAQHCTAQVRVINFEFSAAGISRKAAAA